MYVAVGWDSVNLHFPHASSICSHRLVHHVVSPWPAILASCRGLGPGISGELPHVVAAPPAAFRAMLGRRLDPASGSSGGLLETAPLPAPSSSLFESVVFCLKVRTFLPVLCSWMPSVLFQMPAVPFQMPAVLFQMPGYLIFVKLVITSVIVQCSEVTSI